MKKTKILAPTENADDQNKISDQKSQEETAGWYKIDSKHGIFNLGAGQEARGLQQVIDFLRDTHNNPCRDPEDVPYLLVNNDFVDARILTT